MENCFYLKGESESEVAQSCPTLCDPTDCSLPGSFILKGSKHQNKADLKGDL